ncbi:MAG: GGDEF domain-containing protein [Acidobacteria bacterium]|nr:GGDEF domain-containing protein [Acidobacteriota bacterium]MBV9625707.1 GGDEF domain-containing protein [Acidobacteriota bacterium]
MEFWTKRTFQSIFLPGGLIFATSVILLKTESPLLSTAGVSFFYYVFIVAAALLAWRFRSTRVLLCVLVLVLSHYGVAVHQPGRAAQVFLSRSAFEAVAIFTPLDLLILAFFPERGAGSRPLAWFFGLILLEVGFIKFVALPQQAELSFLHYSPLRAYHLRLPQLALLTFSTAAGLLLYRLLQFRKAIDAGMFWALIAACVGLESSAPGTIGTAYFGVAGLILASSIIENSYVLAFQDELTGLASRRAFNDALLGLKPPYAIAAVDIDHFKSINDSYGHDTGDQVLRLVGSRLARIIGGGEAFRVGGEEFTIIFRGRSAEEVTDFLELLRLDIEGTPFRIRSGQERRKKSRTPDRRAAGQRQKRRFRPSLTLSVTVSIGIAESQTKLTVDEVIQQADQALYAAKQGGRNRVELAFQRRAKRGVKPEGRSRR